MGTASEVSYAAPVIKVSQEMDNPLKLALAVDVFVTPQCWNLLWSYLHLAQQRLAFKGESNVCFVLQFAIFRTWHNQMRQHSRSPCSPEESIYGIQMNWFRFPTLMFPP